MEPLRSKDYEKEIVNILSDRKVWKINEIYDEIQKRFPLGEADYLWLSNEGNTPFEERGIDHKNLSPKEKSDFLEDNDVNREHKFKNEVRFAIKDLKAANKVIGIKKAHYQLNESLNTIKKDNQIGALRAIKIRRGQAQFRNTLLSLYSGRCLISGSGVEPILEAAHIMPYSEKPDNSTNNGLILRADLHTLFDLNLLGINPEDNSIHLHDSLIDTEYSIFQGKKIKPKVKLNIQALKTRWKNFKEKT